MRTRSLSSKSSSRPNFDAIRLVIEYVAPRRVWVRHRKVRKHGQAQIRELAAGIDRTGFNVPLLVDEELALVSGHARLAAAELFGIGSVPVLRITHLTEEQIRLFAIFENRVAESAEWDEEALALEFDELRLEDSTLELTDSGFAIAEIDAMAGRSKTLALSDLDSTREPDPTVPEVTRVGDLWQCGLHRILCGDCTDPEEILRLTAGAVIRQVVCDPPFDLPTKAFSSSKKFGNFAMGAGEMGPVAFTDFLARFMAAARPVLVEGAFV